jgi:precorrin-2 dehydrogenase/sirohydrochlorin ferrochelatase
MSQPQGAQKYYPIFLNMVGQLCVVIGGGEIAERKVKTLLEAGAVVTLITPECTEGLEAMTADPLVTWHQRKYETGDLEGAFIAIASTDDRAVNDAVSKEAAERNTPLNVVDITDMCTFIAPSIIRRGPVTLAISTGGMGPALARKLRQELEHNEALAFADMAEMVADVRAELKARPLTVDPEGWQAALNTEVLGLYQSGQPTQARERMIELLETWADRAQAGVS